MQAEKRELTIFFCDVLGSTRLAQVLSIDDFVEVMLRYHRCAYQTITIKYGYVVQHLGDGVMAYFGYPAAFDHAPAHAVHAGLNLLQEIKTIQKFTHASFGQDFDIRMSVHTGEVIMAVLGIGDRKERLAMGEAPNISARLQGLAPKNGIAISAATYERVSDIFDCKPLGHHKLKGVTEHVPVFQPLRVKAQIA